MAPAQVRRVLTSHSEDGKAIFSHDEELTLVNPVTKKPPTEGKDDGSVSGAYMALIHRTTGYPPTNQGADDELDVSNLQRSKGGVFGGTICEVVELPPMKETDKLGMHRNQSIDYGVILKGSVTLVLDDGVEKTLREGDVYVQRGTMHAWKNLSGETCRFLTVIIPAESVKVATTGEYLQASKLPGLTD
ncbi:hypothetical protein NA57DRAFT_73150 [Rhizodiscina lignyota]|uniref:Cupin type-2 domain-containing protein n=1 Tax=Rhizodiscina lignyota TaxID=1504668 RepID=A0A9P4M8J6_9PEZI|nr:hypothetical protein NA57DRAFT_73150 [Rhizodiscina lignyota]